MRKRRYISIEHASFWLELINLGQKYSPVSLQHDTQMLKFYIF